MSKIPMDEKVQRYVQVGGALVPTVSGSGDWIPSADYDKLFACSGVLAFVLDLRAQGWSVAVHNDYRINDEPYTFWLFTKGNEAVKGEGRTDAEALNCIRCDLATRFSNFD